MNHRLSQRPVLWLITLLCLLSGGVLQAYPMLNHYRFGDRIWLTPWPKTVADRIGIEPADVPVPPGALRIAHTPPGKTSVYDGLRFAAAPGVLEMKCQVRQTSGEGDFDVIFNFNRATGGNGSAGTRRFTVKADSQWREITLSAAVPPETVSMQFIFALDGAARTLLLNDLYFGYAPDTLTVPAGGVRWDAPLTDAGWNPKTPLAGFYVNDRPAASDTTAQIAVTAEGLYCAFVNPEKSMPQLAARIPAAERDRTELFQDDCNELFVYDPVQQRGWQFAVNANGALFDGEIYQKQDGDPRQIKPEWNAPVKVAATRNTDSWESRFFIPWNALNLTFADGLRLKLNFCREHKSTSENLSWNSAPAARFNDPNQFATLTIDGGKATLVRFRSDEKISYLPVRRTPRFAELLDQGTPGGYRVGAWGHGADKGSFPKPLLEAAGEAEFNRWQRDLMAAWGEAGMSGPAFPWLSNYLDGGAAAVQQLHDRYGMKFPYAMHSSFHSRMAKEAGAAYFLPRVPNKIAPVDPVLRQIMTRYILEIPRDRNYNLMKDKIAFILGFDEPTNTSWEIFSMTNSPENKENLAKLSETIRKEYGFGRYGLMDEFAPATSELPFQRIAFMRWWNDEFRKSCVEWNQALKTVFPGAPFKTATNNTCGGLAPLDYSNLNGIGEFLAVDPYPTSAAYNFGPARALYHTGYSVRLLHDLAPAMRTMAMCQAFSYCGGAPGKAELREWASQALKNGASSFYWYCQDAPYQIFPEYLAMLNLNRVIAAMDRVKLPEKTVTGIFSSDYDRYALRDNVCHPEYSIYAILGEHLKSNFRFVSATGIANGATPLDGLKLLYVPRLTWTDPALTAKLKQWVENGGILVVFDPRFLAWNIDGSIPAERADLAGVLAAAPKAGIESVIWNGKSLPLHSNAHISLPTGMKPESYAMSFKPDARTVAVYPDGTVAAAEYSCGRGKVILFAAQPFGNSAAAVRPGDWVEFFRAMARDAGETVDLPIWDFTIPEMPETIKLEPLQVKK